MVAELHKLTHRGSMSTTRRTFLARTAQAAALASAGTGTLRALAPAATFPADFAWGASTSAMQVEGYPYADGGGRSVWSVLDNDPAKVADGSNNLVADDTFHRWADDIPIMQSMGLNSYRLSVWWPRVLPQGRGTPNQKGLDYYDRLFDALLKAGIAPWVTVHHFDYPAALDQQGGWLHEDSPKWLADYAHLLAARYGDRVRHWMTINEPNIYWGFMVESGGPPLSKHYDHDQLALGAHRILEGHGRSVQAIRAAARKPPQVGLPFAGMFSMPASDGPADIEAAREQSFALVPTELGSNSIVFGSNGWWLDPLYRGEYNQACFRYASSLSKLATPASMALIRQPLDFCAINLYFGGHVRAGADGKPEAVADPPEMPRSHAGWSINPELLYWAPKFLYERYSRPIVVTENGISLTDKPDAQGRVSDPRRSAFLRDYLRNYLRASREGVPLGGYFHWSLLDNWEFTRGYAEQFGLVYVDRATQKRTPKESVSTYREIIRSRGAALAGG